MSFLWDNVSTKVQQVTVLLEYLIKKYYLIIDRLKSLESWSFIHGMIMNFAFKINN